MMVFHSVPMSIKLPSLLISLCLSNLVYIVFVNNSFFRSLYDLLILSWIEAQHQN